MSYLERLPQSNKVFETIEGELNIVDETWLQELNKRNLSLEAENSAKWDFAIVFVSAQVVNKLNQEEQAKFEMIEFQLATNEIENWVRV